MSDKRKTEEGGKMNEDEQALESKEEPVDWFHDEMRSNGMSDEEIGEVWDGCDF